MAGGSPIQLLGVMTSYIHPNKTCPWTHTASMLAEKDWAGSRDPHRRPPISRPWKDSQAMENQREKLWGGEGTGLDTKCQCSRLREPRGRSRKEPPRQEQTLGPRVGQETGLALAYLRLMSWKQEEMAQHVKATGRPHASWMGEG